MHITNKNVKERETMKSLLTLKDKINGIGSLKPFTYDCFNESTNNLSYFIILLGIAKEYRIKLNPYIVNQIESCIKAFSVKKGNCTKEFKCFKLLCKELLVNLESENYDYNSIIHNETGAVIYNFETDTPEEVFKKLCRILNPERK